MPAAQAHLRPEHDHQADRGKLRRRHGVRRGDRARPGIHRQLKGNFLSGSTSCACSNTCPRCRGNYAAMTSRSSSERSDWRPDSVVGNHAVDVHGRRKCQRRRNDCDFTPFQHAGRFSPRCRLLRLSGPRPASSWRSQESDAIRASVPSSFPASAGGLNRRGLPGTRRRT